MILPRSMFRRWRELAGVWLLLAALVLASACGGSGKAMPTPSASSLDSQAAEQALRDYIAASIPQTRSNSVDFSLRLRSLAFAEQRSSTRLVYRATFRTQPGMTSSVLPATVHAVFSVLWDQASGRWQVRPQTAWVRALVR